MVDGCHLENIIIAISDDDTKWVSKEHQLSTIFDF